MDASSGSKLSASRMWRSQAASGSTIAVKFKRSFMARSSPR